MGGVGVGGGGGGGVFFFNDTATTEIYTLSLHDALPIWKGEAEVTEHVTDCMLRSVDVVRSQMDELGSGAADRKSTRLNSSH